jgi:AraC family transcriptional regulator
MQLVERKQLPALPRALSESRMRELDEYIRMRMGSTLTLGELAATLPVSRFHFCRIFKRATSMTPHAYVNEQRMQEARRLLVETGETISVISRRVGYRTQAHFAARFRRRWGMTPSECRALSRMGSHSFV